MQSKLRVLIILVLGGMFSLQSFALIQYVEEGSYLSSLMDKLSDSSLPPSEQAKRIVGFLRDKPVITNDSYFILPIFSVFRATPRQVAEQGGDCSDRSRLTIRLLQRRGIKSSKWALYSADMRPQHAVVEVKTEQGLMVIDPLFGLWFPRVAGGFYAIKDLKENPSILKERIKTLIAQGERPGQGRLEYYPLDLYIYDYARTVNWDKSPLMKVGYSSMKLLLGQQVDDMPRPMFVESPELMVVIVLTGFEVVILLVWFVCRRVVQQERLNHAA